MFKNIFYKHKWKWIILILVILFIVSGYIFYQTIYLDSTSKIEFQLLGDNDITLNVFEEYKENGTKATFRGKDITKNVTVDGNVDTNKIGTYNLLYTVEYKGKKANLKRIIKVVDTVAPQIQLYGENKYSMYVGETFNDPGVQAIDNYDGDITSSVNIDNPINSNTAGIYIVTYEVSDTSGNITSITREIEVKNKPIISQGIAVLNYHFFYSDGEECNQGICLNTTKFEEQLKYLKDNGYKTLKMDEFVRWMYGEVELPEKSVLLTIDDGAMGTGFHNGNKLIPLLEKYEVHATLFLVTGWWDINNYKSEYLDVESHTNDMHNEGFCSGVTRGARMLCSSYAVALADLKKSIEITGSNEAFCYPFYAYNDEAIKVVKDAGFKVAFAGGGYKATRNSNKYAIPRYPIYSNISLETFINYIS